MKHLLLLIVLCIAAVSSEAQVNFVEHPAVNKLMSYYVTQGKSQEIIDGWRIKIISTTDRRALESAKYKFEQYFPEYKCEQNYEAPHYSLKVGAFETRLDLEPMLVAFKKDFPLAIPFRDRLNKSELF